MSIPNYQQVWSRAHGTSAAKFSLSIFIFQKWAELFLICTRKTKLVNLQVLLLNKLKNKFCFGFTFKQAKEKNLFQVQPLKFLNKTCCLAHFRITVYNFQRPCAMLISNISKKYLGFGVLKQFGTT